MEFLQCALNYPLLADAYTPIVVHKEAFAIDNLRTLQSGYKKGSLLKKNSCEIFSQILRPNQPCFFVIEYLRHLLERQLLQK